MSAIAAALVKAQKEFGPALKTSSNPHFKSRYADLAACVEAVVEAFNNNGIFLMQPTHDCDDGVIVETLFIHESGEQMSSGKLHVPAAKRDAQGYGSALTYARRYSLMTACGIVPEDDDGNSASKPKPAPAPAPKSAAPPAEKPRTPEKIAGKESPWQLKVVDRPDGDPDNWAEVVVDMTRMGLTVATNEADVMSIFKVNRNIFDLLKTISPDSYDSVMDSFKKAKTKFREEGEQE
jgi:hypothetical protein